VTPRSSTTKTLRSEGGAADDCLRVFVAEESASDLFWLEMVFKSSRLPYAIEVVTDALAAKEYLERQSDSTQPDLVFIDRLEIIEELPAARLASFFVLTKSVSSDDQEKFRSNFGELSQHYIEKPFTQQKLLECLSAAELNSWAERLSGKTPALAIAG
jgi:CheY-like chemotaxis protein